jgi:phenylacetic acid degradation operon negative regulatory protein
VRDSGAQRGPAGALPAREALIALLGDYWFHTTEPIPSAALVAVLADLGVGDAGARAALSRLSRRGTIECTRDGRRTAYRFTPEMAAVAARRGRLLMGFGLPGPAWDRRWTCVAFSLPDERSRLRPVLRSGLRRLGLAPLYDGLWVSPRDLSGPAAQVLDEMGVAASTVFRARVPPRGAGRDPAEAWDLDELRERYRRFTASMEAIAGRLRAGAVAPDESLVVRTTVTNAWRTLVHSDPHLPAELLPSSWPLAGARAAFIEVYDGLGPLAEARARAIVAPFDLGPDARPRHHTVGELL